MCWLIARGAVSTLYRFLKHGHDWCVCLPVWGCVWRHNCPERTDMSMEIFYLGVFNLAVQLLLCCLRCILLMRPPTRCDRLRVFPVFDKDGIIQMLKQELAAYYISRLEECVLARSKTAYRVVNAKGRPPFAMVDESRQVNDCNRASGSCRVCLFIGVSSLQRPAREGHPVGGGFGVPIQQRPQQTCSAEKSQISTAIQFYSASTLSKNPFQAACLVADGGWDMTGLKPDASQVLNHTVRIISSMDNEVQYKLHILTRTIYGQFRNCTQCTSDTHIRHSAFAFFDVIRSPIWTLTWH